MSVSLTPLKCIDGHYDAKELEYLRDMTMAYVAELFKYYPLGVKPPVVIADQWLMRATPNVFMIKSGEETAGFVVVAVRPCIPGVSGNFLQEFYIKPEFRNSSTALMAGGALMHLLPGEWTTDVQIANEPSQRFTTAMTRRYGHCIRMRHIYTEYGQFVRFRWEV